MDLNRRNMKKILLIVAFGVILFWGLFHINGIGGVLTGFFHLIMPFLLGLCLAFIFNVPLRFIENRLFEPLNRKKNKVWEKVRRPLCILLTLLLFAGIICLVIFLLIPELIRTVTTLTRMVPEFIDNAGVWLEQTAKRLHLSENLFQSLQDAWNKMDWGKVMPDAISFLQDGAVGILNTASSFVTGIFNLVLGIAFSIYLLFQKEKLSGQMRRLAYAFFPEKKVDCVVRIGKSSNRTFSNFIAGQFLEAIIIGALCFIGMLLLRLPFAAMISVLVGFTALIPIFGAFIGTAIGAFLILMENPLQALWFIIFIVVLQQIEGNLIYPRVVGTSVGLPGIWVLVAVTLGGSLMGIVGMLLFVPLSSVLYCILREVVDYLLEKKRIRKEKLSPDPPQAKMLDSSGQRKNLIFESKPDHKADERMNP